jgi:uncharacterized protein
MMSTRSGAIIASLTLASIIACAAPAPLDAIEPTLELKWDQLVPPAPPKPPKPFFAGRGPVDLGKFGGPDDGSPAPPPLPEGRWMSVPRRSNAGPETVPVVASLGGKRVHIGGYVVPLDFDATRVTNFLLVPFVGACIHVPPPPANQIIYVRIARGLNVQGTFDPVWVTGTLNVTPTFTGLAEAGYTIEAEKVESRPRG